MLLTTTHLNLRCSKKYFGLSPAENMKAVAFSSKCSFTFESKVPRDVHVRSLLFLAQSPSTATGGCHPVETGYSAGTKQKVSSREAPSVKHMKGELT